MKRIFYGTFPAIIAICILSAPLYSVDNPFNIEKPEGEVHVTEQEQLLKLSEAFGHFIGRNLKNPGINFDLNSLIKGIRDGSEGKPAPLADEEYEQLMTMFQAKAYFELSDKNLEASNEFLQKNAEHYEVVQLIEGKLQYQIITPGKGEEVKETDTPTIHFTAKLLDGTVVGTTANEAGPIPVNFNQTLPGLKKGIIGMREGEMRRLFIHPELAYGMSGQLPPNALLIVDVELVNTRQSSLEAEVKEKDLSEDEPLIRRSEFDELEVEDLIAEQSYLDEYEGYSDTTVYDEEMLRLPNVDEVPHLNYEVDRGTNSETIMHLPGNSPLDDDFELPGW